MSADELNVLQMALSLHWHKLWNLDVVEQAETAVRHAYSWQLSVGWDSALRQLRVACDAVAWVRAGDDLIAIVESEQRLCGLQHLAEAFLARHTRQIEAVQQAEAAYRTSRQAVLRQVEAAQIALDEYQRVVARGR